MFAVEPPLYALHVKNDTGFPLEGDAMFLAEAFNLEPWLAIKRAREAEEHGLAVMFDQLTVDVAQTELQKTNEVLQEWLRDYPKLDSLEFTIEYAIKPVI